MTDKEVLEETWKEFMEEYKLPYAKRIKDRLAECRDRKSIMFLGIKAGRKQLAKEILTDKRLNSQINEAGIRIIIKEKLKKEVEGK